MYAVVDIETTGSRFGTDRITEVAIYQTDGDTITGEWSSLIDPGVPIPPFITQLTGISEDMVAGAPAFGDVAEKILELTKDRVFIAHAVTFDYDFLRRELERAGHLFFRKRLCTVRTARKIIPGFPSYSLGKLCSNLGIPLTDRHRAYGDARATALLWQMLIERDEAGLIPKMLQHTSGERNLPPLLSKATFLSIPEAAGVYYFHNAKGHVIYTGKARNIRRRVAGHFGAAERNSKEARLRQLTADVTFEVTGSELIALLLESIEIKRLDPVFNSAQKIWLANYGVVKYADQHGYMRFGIVKSGRNKRSLITFPDLISARSYLQRKTREFNLCQRLSGLHTVSGACYDHKIGSCSGACVQEESADSYNEKMVSCINSFAEEFKNILIVGKGREHNERSVISIEQGRYLGYGYFDRDSIDENPESLRSVVKVQPDNADAQRILHSWLRSDHNDIVIEHDPLQI